MKKENMSFVIFQDLKLDYRLLTGESPFAQQIRHGQIASILGYFERLSPLLLFPFIVFEVRC